MKFARPACAKVRLRVHLGLYQDETASLCHWQIPMAHYLESWSDARAADGTVTIIQPLIAPLYNGRTAHELIATMTKQAGQTPYEIVRAYWQGPGRAARRRTNFEKFWRKALHDGMIAGHRRGCPDAVTAGPVTLGTPPPAKGLEIVFRARPVGLRRPLRQQRLAAGTAEAELRSSRGTTPRW